MVRKTILILLGLTLGACFVYAQAAPDPIYLATGARPLGMGKAFTGLADDVGAVFLNPAGIANPERWQLTSMSGKLIDEFNYLSLSGLYPTNYGNFGIAFIGTSVSGALPTTVEAGSDPTDPIYAVDLSQDPMSYYNNLLMLSYGTKLSRLLTLPWLTSINSRFPALGNFNFGANIKLYSVNLTGDHITQGNASGSEMDIGLQGKAYNWLSLGGAIQNVLPASMGGKLHYETGWDESYPALLKLGVAANVLGPKDALRALGSHQLKLLADLDYEISRSDKVPPILHLGLEWKPMELLALRAGIDQDTTGPTSTVNNFTSGVGLYYGDFRFDYAYHQFDGAPGIDNHFFSLSYGISQPKKLEDPLISTPDKLITTNPTVKVEGSAVDRVITKVKVNGLEVKIGARGEFANETAINIGKNSILVEGLDSASKLVSADRLRVLRLITYPDVAKEYWASEQIGYIGTLGIIKGYPDGKFKPDGNITRAELSTLLIRTKMGSDDQVPAATKLVFKDVALKHWAVKYINLAAQNGIVTGYPDGSFKPMDNITRAEGLAMIARFGSVPQVKSPPLFTDIKATHWAAPIITGAQQAGMLAFLKDKPFEPNKKLTRAEAVEMLYRSAPVKLLVGDLLSFDKGY
jgi:hypothetical protein